MKITIIAVGKLDKKSPEHKLIEEYVKKISAISSIDIVEVYNKNNGSDIVLQKESEANLLTSKIPIGAFVILLDENGENLSSKQFSSYISKLQIGSTKHLAFLIGGAYGHGDLAKKRADFSLSFGKMTYAHMLIRVMLLEQIYRAFTIINNHPYHK